MTQGTQFEELDLSLSKLGNKINTHHVIITGDFNLTNINWENHHVTPNSGHSTIAANKLLSLSLSLVKKHDRCYLFSVTMVGRRVNSFRC